MRRWPGPEFRFEDPKRRTPNLPIRRAPECPSSNIGEHSRFASRICAVEFAMSEVSIFPTLAADEPIILR